MNKWKVIPVIFMLGVAVTAAIPFLKDCKEDIKQDNKQKEIRQKVIKVEKKENIVDVLKKDNPDVVGYLNIPGTSIDYPVMQTKENSDFYLNHDFDKEYSFYGTPYLSAYCDLKESDNLIIYGHNISGGRMFGALTKYKDEKFYKQHKIIKFITDQEYEYEIFAVMSVNINEFEYWKFTMARDEADYNGFVNTVIGNSIYDTGVVPEHGEQMICLSTCDNSRGDLFRFVVLAKKV